MDTLSLVGDHGYQGTLFPADTPASDERVQRDWERENKRGAWDEFNPREALNRGGAGRRLAAGPPQAAGLPHTWLTSG